MTVTPPPAPPYGQQPPPPQQPPYGGAYPQYPQPQQPPPKKGSGCGKIAAIGCAVILVLGVIAAVVIGLGYFTMIKKTDVYREARDKACNDPRVIAALGEPVSPGFAVTGGISVDSSGGKANVHFPIKGSKGKGKVDAEATNDGSKWTFTKLTATPDGGTPIDLLTSP